MFEKLKLAEVTSKEIEEVRDGYRPAARRGAVLFFVLSEMAAINSMYQYSLSSYLEVSSNKFSSLQMVQYNATMMCDTTRYLTTL